FSSDQRFRDYINLIKEDIKLKKEREEKEQKISKMLSNAQAQQEKGKLEKAKDYFNEILALEQNNKQAIDGIEQLDKLQKTIAQEKQKKIRAEDLAKQGIEAYNSKDYDKAKQSLAEALKEDPENINADKYLKKAQEEILVREQKKKKIEEFYKQGDQLYKDKKFSAAIEVFEKGLNLSGETRFRDYIDNVKKDSEKEKERIEREEKISKMLSNAQAQQKQGKLDKARKYYSEIIALDQNNKQAMDGIGQIEEFQKKIEAEKQAKINSQELFKKAIVSFKSKDYKKAKDLLDASLNENSENKESKKYLEKVQEIIFQQNKEEQLLSLSNKELENGRKLFEDKKYREAKKSIEKAIYIYKTNEQAIQYLLKVNIAIKDEEKEKEQSNKLEEKLGKIREKAISLYDDGKLQNAKKEFNEVLMLAPLDKEAQEYIKAIDDKVENERMEKEKQSKAVELYEEANVLVKNGSFVSAAEKLEQSLALDRNEKTEELLEKTKAIIRESREKEDLVIRSNELVQSGEQLLNDNEPEKAVVAFSQAIEIYPDNEKAKEKIKETQSVIVQKKKKEKNKPMAQRLVEKGIESYDDQQYEVAITMLERAGELYPNDESVQVILDKARLKAQQRKLEREKEKESNKLYEQGQKLLKTGESSQAKELLKESIETNPLNISAKKSLVEAEEKENEDQKILQSQDIYEQGQKLFKEKKYVFAKEKFKEAINVYSSNEQAINMLVKVNNQIKIEEENNRIMESQKIYEQAKEIYAGKEVGQAKDLLSRALIVYSGNVQAEKLLERIKKDEKEKEAELREKKIKRTSEKAKELFKTKHLAESKVEFKKVLEIDPQNKDAQKYIEKIEKEVLADISQAKESPDTKKIEIEKSPLIAKQESVEKESIEPEQDKKDDPAKEKLQKQIDLSNSLYEQALDSYEKKEYEQAKEIVSRAKRILS
ncbi:MAG: hypothetical protein PHQ52_06825, partial [Candidatus Omnitrophica bacterium]|nr:hypothetical protein [Candidatus Omnitrophota bacterium]